MKFETSPTVSRKITIKNGHHKKIGELSVTYQNLGIEEASRLVEERKKLLDGESENITIDRTLAMKYALTESLLEHMPRWGLCDSSGEPMEINEENLDRVLSMSEYFHPIWRDFDTYTTELAMGIDIKKMNREAERKNLKR